MPSTPNRREIFENILAVLATITTGNGYNQTVTGVDRTIRTPTTLGASELPRLIVIADPEARRLESLAGRQIRETITFDIYGVIAAATAAARTQALDRLEDDIIAALYLDLNRGTSGTPPVPNATNTKLVDAWSTDSIDEERDSSGGRGLLMIRIECVFFRNTSRTPPLT